MLTNKINLNKYYHILYNRTYLIRRINILIKNARPDRSQRGNDRPGGTPSTPPPPLGANPDSGKANK